MNYYKGHYGFPVGVRLGLTGGLKRPTAAVDSRRQKTHLSLVLLKLYKEALSKLKKINVSYASSLEASVSSKLCTVKA